jgi:hypothetical protein
MKKPYLLVTVALVLAAGLGASGVRADDQEGAGIFRLSLITETMALPFAMPNLPNMANIPGLAAMFKPRRSVSSDAVYPNKAVAPIWVSVPADLHLPDNKLVLNVPPPSTTGGPGGGGGGGGGQAPPVKMEFVTKLYWHPDTAAGPIGSDITIDTSQLPRVPRGAPQMPPSADWQKLLEERARTASGSAQIMLDAATGQGDYTLNTGKLTMPLAGFLPGLHVTAPAALASVNLPDGIPVTWDPVPGARGYILRAMSMTKEGDKTTLIRWVSTLQQPPGRVQNGEDYQQDTTISDDLAASILLPAGTVSCMVPPGIFPEKPDFFTLSVIAVGADYYDKINNGADANSITIYGKIRSKWTGMKMGHMPGMPPQGAGG